MPLDNSASIKDIITSLQNMEGINAKADLASVVGSPATAGDTMATINNVIQQAKNDLADKTGQIGTNPLRSLVDNTVIGKKWASGELINSANTPTVTIRGLPFKPSLVAFYLKEGFTSTYSYLFKINFDTSNPNAVVLIPTFGSKISDVTGYGYGGQDYLSLGKNHNSNNNFYDEGFQITARTGDAFYASKLFEWVAVE